MTSSVPRPTRHRLAWVEWVRGIAALLVVLVHFLGEVPAVHYFTREVFDLGRVGVVAFFLVSGFVIPLSYRRQTTPVFIVRRFTRLYPIYWLILIVAITIDPRTDWSNPSWWIAVGLNVTMLQHLVTFSIIPVAWTLTIELVFYLQQIAAKTVRQLDRAYLLGYFWAFIFLIAIVAEHLLNRQLPISFPMLLAVSCMGHAMSLTLQGVLPKHATILMTIIVTATIALGGLARAAVDPEWPPLLYVVSFLGGGALFAIAYLLRNTHELRWAVWLGGISYALYLVHSVIWAWLRSLPYDLFWPGFIVALLASIGAAWLLHKYVEKPCIRIGHAFRATRAVCDTPAQKPVPSDSRNR